MWLNEGFASWIEYLCVDHCFPEYDIWTQFVSADYTRALDLDALDNSHPIEVRMMSPFISLLFVAFEVFVWAAGICTLFVSLFVYSAV